jgi:hypothetical protein
MENINNTVIAFEGDLTVMILKNFGMVFQDDLTVRILFGALLFVLWRGIRGKKKREVVFKIFQIVETENEGTKEVLRTRKYIQNHFVESREREGKKVFWEGNSMYGGAEVIAAILEGGDPIKIKEIEGGCLIIGRPKAIEELNILKRIMMLKDVFKVNNVQIIFVGNLLEGKSKKMLQWGYWMDNWGRVVLKKNVFGKEIVKEIKVTDVVADYY